jgi:hypothetical protein
MAATNDASDFGRNNTDLAQQSPVKISGIVSGYCPISNGIRTPLFVRIVASFIPEYSLSSRTESRVSSAGRSGASGRPWPPGLPR